MLLQGVGLTYGALAASCQLMSDVGIINGQMPNRKVTWEGPPTWDPVRGSDSGDDARGEEGVRFSST